MKKIILVFALLWAHHAFGQTTSTAHTATYAVNNSSCTSVTPCTLQIWRVVVANGASCPAVGNSLYINVQSNLAPDNVSSVNSHWDYVDSGASLVSGGNYCGYTTATFTAGGGPGAASAIFQGTIPTPITPPVAPTQNVTLAMLFEVLRGLIG